MKYRYFFVVTVAACLAGAGAARVDAADKPAAAGQYQADPAHSTLEYQFVQAGAQNKGKFTKLQVTVGTAAQGPDKLDVVVDTKSLDTGDKERDDTMRSPDLFDTGKYPQAHFVSTQITATASGFDAAGKLTIRNVTRDVHVTFTWRAASEQGKPVAYLAGKIQLRRLDYGIGQGDWKSTEWVGNDVAVSYSLRLTGM